MQPKPLERDGASPSLIAKSSHLCPTVWGFWWEHHRKGNVFPIKGFQWRRKREKARDTDQDREKQTDRGQAAPSLTCSWAKLWLQWIFILFLFPLPLTGSVTPLIKSALSGNTGIINKVQGYSPIINIKHVILWFPPPFPFFFYFPCID